MITDSLMSAPFGTSQHWDTIEWHPCERNTRKLQARIAQAVKNGRWNKVKALQHLLTRSFSAKALAVKRVTSNRGKATAGVDGRTWLTAASKSGGIGCLRQRGYHAQPLRRVYIPKSNGKQRPLGIPTMKDRAMQALYEMGVSPVAETTGDNHSYGFRKHRSAADAISQIFIVLAKRTAPQWIMEGDIQKCFDQINHDWLIRSIPIETNMLQKWLKAGYIEKKTLYPTKAGTPQGGIISPTLANMTLDGLEESLSKHFGRQGSKRRKAYGVNLIRYADDFVISGKSRNFLEEQVKPIVVEFMEQRGLTLSPEKTKVTHIHEGFDFLGQTVKKYKAKLIIKPSQKSLKALLERASDLIHKGNAKTQEELIRSLNPQIRRWANYHRGICARKTFEKVDHAIFGYLWRWAKRRHPNKGLHWIKEKYFKQEGHRFWVFATKTSEQEEWLRLTLATDIPIRRHIKIKSTLNPFDPSWHDYLIERKTHGHLIRNLYAW